METNQYLDITADTNVKLTYNINKYLCLASIYLPGEVSSLLLQLKNVMENPDDSAAAKELYNEALDLPTLWFDCNYRHSS